MAKHKILSTKKLDTALIEQARAADVEVMVQETIRIEPLLNKEKWEELELVLQSENRYAIFTSSNAVEVLAKYLHEFVQPTEPDWQLFSLSGKTRETIESTPALRGKIIATADHAEALAGIILENGVTEALFFCGNKRRDVLPSRLGAAGVALREIVLYETILTPFTLREAVDGVLFFSPSSVESFFSANQLPASTVYFAIGETTAEALKQAGATEVLTSSAPTQENIIKEVLNHFHKTASTE